MGWQRVVAVRSKGGRVLQNRLTQLYGYSCNSLTLWYLAYPQISETEYSGVESQRRAVSVVQKTKSHM